MTEVFITCNFRSKETRRSCCMSWTPCRQSSRSATCHPQGKNILSKEKNILYNTLLFRLQKEKEDAYTDIDRGREKYEKLQVIRLNCTEYFQQVFIFPAISWIVRQSKCLPTCDCDSPLSLLSPQILTLISAWRRCETSRVPQKTGNVQRHTFSASHCAHSVRHS